MKIQVVAAERFRPLLETGGVLDRCNNYVQDLMRQLALPLRPELVLDTASEHSREADLRIVVNSERITLWSLADLDADGLTQAIGDCLLRCRSLFVDATVARGIWILWFPERASDFDNAGFAGEFRELCGELVARGLKPERAKKYVNSWVPGAIDRKTHRSALEQALAGTRDVAIGLHFSPEEFARWFDDGGKALTSGDDKQSLPEMLDMMADGLFYELGLTYRMEDVRVDRELHAPWFRIRWNDVSTPPIRGLDSNEFLVNDTVDRLTLLSIKAREAVNPANQSECAIVQGDAKKVCEDAGLTTWNAAGFTVLHASSEIRRNAGAFVTGNLTALYQIKLGEAFPDLMTEATKRFDREELTGVLRLLLDEEITIRDLRGVLEALLAVNAVTTADLSKLIVFAPKTGIQCPVHPGRALGDLGLSDYCDSVRMAMKRYISHKHTRGGNTLVVYLVAPAIEDRLREGTALSPQEREKLLDAIGEEIGALPSNVQTLVILTTYDVRRRLRQLITYDFPRVAVLSYQELSPDMNIQPIARIAWN